MSASYVVDAAAVPWRRGATEGIAFSCQVLLSGEDGGPEALRFRFDDHPSVYAHMHLTAQFQLLIGGAMDFPRGVKHLEALSLHYTDRNVPYGPFAVSGGHDMLVLHPRCGGIVSMANRDARRKINLEGRLCATPGADSPWRPMEGGVGECKFLLPQDFGPDAFVLRVPRGAALVLPPAPFGRYEVVLEGSARVGEQTLGPAGLRYLRDEAVAEPLVAGDNGATVAFLTFDRAALEGGITDDALSVEAAEAMARAI